MENRLRPIPRSSLGAFDIGFLIEVPAVELVIGSQILGGTFP